MPRNRLWDIHILNQIIHWAGVYEHETWYYKLKNKAMLLEGILF